MDRAHDGGVALVLAWLSSPAGIAALPGASRAEVLWLTLSAIGLLFTALNLVSAVRTGWWQDRYQPDATLLNAIASAHQDKALALVVIDLACVGIGVAAVLNLSGYPAVLVLGLLVLRVLLPAVAFRDVLLRRHVTQIERRRRRRTARARDTSRGADAPESDKECRNA